MLGLSWTLLIVYSAYTVLTSLLYLTVTSETRKYPAFVHNEEESAKWLVLHFPDRRVRERTLEKLWRKNSGAMESFIMALEVKLIFN